MIRLSQKETALLKDLKDQEQLCADKYTRHASCAVDPQLKNLFTQLAQNELQHLQTLSELEQGTLPQMGGSGGSQLPTGFSDARADAADQKEDRYLCTDVLAGEKHASHLYDTCVFEFKDTRVRDVLNHIQKEEQEHGKKLYDYMSCHGMTA